MSIVLRGINVWQAWTTRSDRPAASAASPTFASRLQRNRKANVGDRSSTRNNELLVFLMVQTFALVVAAKGGNCLIRSTSVLVWTLAFGRCSDRVREFGAPVGPRSLILAHVERQRFKHQQYERRLTTRGASFILAKAWMSYAGPNRPLEKIYIKCYI